MNATEKHYLLELLGEIQNEVETFDRTRSKGYPKRVGQARKVLLLNLCSEIIERLQDLKCTITEGAS